LDDENGFVLVNEHLPHPSEEHCNEMVRLPPNHPAPLNKFAVKEFSICVYLFGGNDFSESPPETKLFSRWDTMRDNQECMREGSEGGPNRDHTVCVEIKVSKVSLNRQQFAPNASILSLGMLTIGDIEVLDHLCVSQINKLFYQVHFNILDY
jgi:hypothetical protein